VSRPIITLTTDFGSSDPFVGILKGVILSIHREVELIDITHNVNSFDLFDGALAIASAYSYFPSDTIHLVVVDPGVGSNRRPILATNERYHFIAPDNGILSGIYERSERLTVRHIDAPHYYRQPVSQTFHGRDIFAPIAAWLSKGVQVTSLGEEITDFIRFAMPKPKPVDANTLKGVVMRSDRFGNLLTNIRAEDVAPLFSESAPAFKATCGKAEIKRICKSYSEGAQNEPFLIVGSSGYIEISANKTPANRLIGADRGAEVTVQLAAPLTAGTTA